MSDEKVELTEWQSHVHEGLARGLKITLPGRSGAAFIAACAVPHLPTAVIRASCEPARQVDE